MSIGGLKSAKKILRGEGDKKLRPPRFAQKNG
jgi:hypothetical protein